MFDIIEKRSKKSVKRNLEKRVSTQEIRRDSTTREQTTSLASRSKNSDKQFFLLFVPRFVRLPIFFPFVFLFLPKTINKRVKSNHRHNRSTWAPTCVFLSFARWSLCAVDCLTFMLVLFCLTCEFKEALKSLLNNRQLHSHSTSPNSTIIKYLNKIIILCAAAAFVK